MPAGAILNVAVKMEIIKNPMGEMIFTFLRQPMLSHETATG
jgi:hypothetical protein